jgi:excisionase family DNA binding protein
MNTEPWVSLVNIAKHLDVHEEPVRRWVQANTVPAAKVGKVWRFKISEIDAWARTGKAINSKGLSIAHD